MMPDLLRARWYGAASPAAYPQDALTRVLIFAGCLVASGAVTHFFFWLLEVLASPGALALLLVILGFAWAPVAVLSFWDPERRWTVVGGVIYVAAVIAAPSLGLAWVLKRTLRARIDNEALVEILNDWQGTSAELGVALVLGLLFYRFTLPALLVGLEELGIVATSHAERG